MKYNDSNVEKCKNELLVKSIEDQHIEITEVLLRYGADPNHITYGRHRDGQTPLHIAIEMCNKTLVSMLLNAKADPNICIDGGLRYGWTPLQLATHYCDVNIVYMLLNKGAIPTTEIHKTMPCNSIIKLIIQNFD